MYSSLSSQGIQQLSQAIEQLLVARNPRGMQSAQAALEPGYYWRAATLLQSLCDTPSAPVLIGTGFPVPQADASYTFETDGPVGAIALYDTLAALGMQPLLVTSGKLAAALQSHYRVHRISEGQLTLAEQEARALLNTALPQAVISIEMPGLNAQNSYTNMRGEDISHMCPSFDAVMHLASCPTLAIGDGGNEIGMGKIAATLTALNIIPSQTQCDELMVADVSNWGAYGIIAWLSIYNNTDLLAAVQPRKILAFLSKHGSVDGVSRENTLTEDGLAPDEGEAVIRQLRELITQSIRCA